MLTVTNAFSVHRKPWMVLCFRTSSWFVNIQSLFDGVSCKSISPTCFHQLKLCKEESCATEWNWWLILPWPTPRERFCPNFWREFRILGTAAKRKWTLRERNSWQVELFDANITASESFSYHRGIRANSPAPPPSRRRMLLIVTRGEPLVTSLIAEIARRKRVKYSNSSKGSLN